MSAPIVSPFTAETAHKKVKVAQDLWNTKNAEKVSLAYTVRSPLSLSLSLSSIDDPDLDRLNNNSFDPTA